MINENAFPTPNLAPIRYVIRDFLYPRAHAKASSRDPSRGAVRAFARSRARAHSQYKNPHTFSSSSLCKAITVDGVLPSRHVEQKGRD